MRERTNVQNTEGFRAVKLLCVTLYGRCMLPYSSPPLPTGDMFQDPQWISETTDSTEHYIYYVSTESVPLTCSKWLGVTRFRRSLAKVFIWAHCFLVQHITINGTYILFYVVHPLHIFSLCSPPTNLMPCPFKKFFLDFIYF